MYHAELCRISKLDCNILTIFNKKLDYFPYKLRTYIMASQGKKEYKKSYVGAIILLHCYFSTKSFLLATGLVLKKAIYNKMIANID